MTLMGHRLEAPVSMMGEVLVQEETEYYEGRSKIREK